MTSRFRRFHVNTGLSGVIRTVIVHLALVGVPLFALPRDHANQTLWTALAVAVAVVWTIPFLARRWLVDHYEVTNTLLKFTGYALVGASLLSSPLGKQFGTATILCVLFPVATAYISTVWWFFSDPQIHRKR